MVSHSDQLVSWLIGICILLYLLHLLTGKKFFGNLAADISQMVLDVFWGICRGIFRSIKNALFPKSSHIKGKKNRGRKKRRRGRRRNN